MRNCIFIVYETEMIISKKSGEIVAQAMKYRYNINSKGVSVMKQTVAAIMAILCFVCVLSVSVAEGTDSPFQFTFDYRYKYTEDGTGIIINRYTGTEQDIVIPSEVEGLPVVAVDDFAFQYMNVTSVIIPEGVESIGTNCFTFCTVLHTVELPDTVKKIGTFCFGGCTALTEVKMSAALEELGDFAFISCSSLPKLVFGNKLTFVGQSAFQMCSSLKRIVIPVDIAKSAVGAFLDCPDDIEIIDAAE